MFRKQGSYAIASVLVAGLALFFFAEPPSPKAFTAGSDPVEKFEGAFTVSKRDPPPGRCFLFHAVIRPRHPRVLQAAAEGKEPPTHFHPAQYEYFEVLSGVLTVEIDDIKHEFTKGDGEFTLPPGPHHRLYAAPDQKADEVVFLISASTGRREFALDQAFFENWYGYQEDVLLRGTSISLLQVLTMFDGGDSYLSLPKWVPEPFRHSIGYWAGVIFGRYIGGLLGYQPFYPEWTTDWDAACDKMESIWAQRRFANRDAQVEARQRFLGSSTSA